MTEVNIYIETDIPPGRNGEGRVIYILEKMTEKGPATLTKLIEEEQATRNRAILDALEEALDRIRIPCSITIYVDCSYVQSAIDRRWFCQWEQNGWRTAKEKAVTDADIWAGIAAGLEPHSVTVCKAAGNSYQEWMRRELKTAKEDAFRRLSGKPV